MAAFSRGFAMTSCCTSSLKISSHSRRIISQIVLIPSSRLSRSFSSSPSHSKIKKPQQRVSINAQVQAQVSKLKQEVKQRVAYQAEVERAEAEAAERAQMKAQSAARRAARRAADRRLKAETMAALAAANQSPEKAASQEQIVKHEEEETNVEGGILAETETDIIPTSRARNSSRKGIAARDQEEEQDSNASYYAPSHMPGSKTADLLKAFHKVMDDGKEVALYRGPNLGVWFTLADAVVIGFGIVFCWHAYDVLTGPELDLFVVKPLEGILLLTGLYVLWKGIRRRAQRVHKMTLVPKRYGKVPVLELRVEGSSWVPFKSKTVQPSVLECSTEIPFKEAKMREAPSFAQVEAHYNIFRPVAYLWNQQFKFWYETVTIFGESSRIFVRLWTEEGNTKPLSSWSLDHRGTFLWHGPRGFDYLIASLPKRERPRERGWLGLWNKYYRGIE